MSAHLPIKDYNYLADGPLKYFFFALSIWRALTCGCSKRINGRRQQMPRINEAYQDLFEGLR